MKLYIVQDRVSRQYGEPFTGFNDEQVRRDMHRAFANGIVTNHPMQDAVCLAIGNVISDENHFIIDNFPNPYIVCSGDDSEVQTIVRDLMTRMEISMEVHDNEKGDN